MVLSKYWNKLEPRSFFEVGCGAGLNLYCIAEMNKFKKDLSYGGVDVNSGAVQEAEKRDYGGGKRFFADSLYNPDFLQDLDDDSFDVVFTKATMEHIVPGWRKKRIIRELYRIAGKCLTLIEPYKEKDMAHFTGSHFVFYEDLRKYLSDNCEVLDIVGDRVIFAYKRRAVTG